MKDYYPRIIDKDITLYLDTFGAILIRGPKWCGKTTTAEKYANSSIKMQDSNYSKYYIEAADVNLSILLNGDRPHLIDEWQVVPKIWDAIRSDVDRDDSPGKYILTGSRVPPEGSTMHSGAGRFGILDMYPMSLYESKDSTGTVSLEKLFAGEFSSGLVSKLSMDDIAYCLCRGGWPSNIGLDYRRCALKLKSYLNLIYEGDDLSLKKYAKDSELAEEILRSYSRNISSIATNITIIGDVSKVNTSFSESKYYDYIVALKNAFIIKDVPAWNPSVRSKTAVRSSPKRELIDPSIAAMYLNITPDNYIHDFNTFGLLFESMCIRDLRVYTSAIGGKVSYYRDRYGLEADAVVTLDDGRYELIEIKLGTKKIDEGAEHLCRLESLLEQNGIRKPVFKMVLTGSNLSYMRGDGVYVVPVGCFGP